MSSCSDYTVYMYRNVQIKQLIYDTLQFIGTVIDNIQEAVVHFKRSQEFRSQRGYVNVPVGKVIYINTYYKSVV